MNSTQIQSNLHGSVELFTGIFYVIRIFGLGQGTIKPSDTSSPSGGYYLEQDIFSNGVPTEDALWFFKPSKTPGFYQWKSVTQPKSIVTYTYYGVDHDDDSSELCPLLELANEQDQDAPEDAMWEFESQDLKEYGYSGLGYKIKNSNLGQGVTTFTGQKSPGGWWLQVDQEEPAIYKTEPRWAADSLFVFEPVNFKLYGETSHLNLEDYHDASRVLQSRSYLVVNQTLENVLADSLYINMTKECYVDYELYTDIAPGSDILSGLVINSINTIPSKKYFDFETAAFDGITNLVAKSFVKATEEFEVEPFSRKNVSAYITYLKEFRGVAFYSYTEVTAFANMMGENGEVVENVVKDVALLKHLIRSRGYQGNIEEIDGDVGKVRIKVEGSIRGSLPIPVVQFEEGPTVHVPRFEQAYKSRNLKGHHLS